MIIIKTYKKICLAHKKCIHYRPWKKNSSFIIEESLLNIIFCSYLLLANTLLEKIVQYKTKAQVKSPKSKQSHSPHLSGATKLHWKPTPDYY